MNCSSLAKASLQCYKGMVLQVYTKAKVEKRVDDEEDDDGWLEECWNAAWMAGWMRRKETMEGHRRTPASLHTSYTILPPNHHHHLLMPSYATLSPPRRSPVEIVATRDGQPCVISLLPGVIRTMLRGIYVPAQPSTVTQCQTIFVSVPARPSYSTPTQVEIDVCKSPSAISSSLCSLIKHAL